MVKRARMKRGSKVSVKPERLAKLSAMAKKFNIRGTETVPNDQFLNASMKTVNHSFKKNKLMKPHHLVVMDEQSDLRISQIANRMNFTGDLLVVDKRNLNILAKVKAHFHGTVLDGKTRIDQMVLSVKDTRVGRKFIPYSGLTIHGTRVLASPRAKKIAGVLGEFFPI